MRSARRAAQRYELEQKRALATTRAAKLNCDVAEYDARRVAMAAKRKAEQAKRVRQTQSRESQADTEQAKVWVWPAHRRSGTCSDRSARIRLRGPDPTAPRPIRPRKPCSRFPASSRTTSASTLTCQNLNSQPSPAHLPPARPSEHRSVAVERRFSDKVGVAK